MNRVFSEKVDKIFPAFIQAQADFPTIDFNQKVDFTFKGRRTYYQYADLAQIRKKTVPVLAKHGLGVSTAVVGPNQISVLLIHESGQFLEWTGEIPASIMQSAKSEKDGGGAITYFRRYFLCCALGVVADEDSEDRLHDQEEPNKRGQRTNAGKGNAPIVADEKFLRAKAAKFAKQFDLGTPIEALVQQMDAAGFKVTDETTKVLSKMKKEFFDAKKEAKPGPKSGSSK